MSLSLLPAVKKDTEKRFSWDVIKDICTYYIVMSLYLMSSIQRTTFLTKLTVQMVNPEAGEHLERKSANQLRPHYKKATRYIPYKSCTTHVTQKDRAFLWQPIWRAYKKSLVFLGLTEGYIIKAKVEREGIFFVCQKAVLKYQWQKKEIFWKFWI